MQPQQPSTTQQPYQKPKRSKAIAIVNPVTKAVVNEDQIADTSPSSSNSSTPAPQSAADHTHAQPSKSTHTAQLTQVSTACFWELSPFQTFQLVC